MEDDIRKNDFNRFMGCLENSGERIDQHYFQLPVAGKEEPVFRERVYCYELYHQLRTTLGDGFPYKLDGEVDKNGHPIIRPTLGPWKPDFIVHIPGNMKRNLVVIEVKPITVKDDMSELKRTLEKLQGFLNEAKYYRAIMLVYGDGKHNLPESIRSEVHKFSKRCGERILMVWHCGFRRKPMVV